MPNCILKTASIAFFVATLFQPVLSPAQTREEKVRADRKKVEAQGFWLYNDLPKAFELARKQNKPILVSLRCIPCEECVKLDDELIDNDPKIRSLLDQFVCVRVVGTNGLDLGIFQFDTDQSFAMFMLNADRTIYGRFGTRSHRTDWQDDVSTKGLGEALKGALALHANYDSHREALAGKLGAPLEFPTPETYPSLQTRYFDKLDYAGDVVKSCIHCHQIGDARIDYYWNQKKPVPEKLLFPYPHPKSIGLILDPDTRAKIKSIKPDSIAANAGLQRGDEILRIKGQPILSIADVQWVLHHAKSDGDKLELVIRRDDDVKNMTLELSQGWRRLGERSWRVSSWGFAGMHLGGMRLESLSKKEKSQLTLPGTMALRAKYVGRYGKHAAAKRAGLQKGDILVEYDGQKDFAREEDLFVYAATRLKPGQKVSVKFLRNGNLRTANIPLQTR